MRLLRTIWRKLSQTKALELAGPLETSFFESVYRLAYIKGLSTSDDYIQYTLYSTAVRSLYVLIVCLEIWHVIANDVSLDDMISASNVIFIHLMTMWKLMTIVRNKKIFKKLAKALESPSFDISTQRRKDIVKYWVNTHWKYLKLLLRLAYLTLFVWETYPLIDEIDFNLMVDVKLPYEYVQQPLRFALTYIVVGIVFAYASCYCIMSEVITQAHLMTLICQFDVLANCFENLFEECAEEFQDIDKHELVSNNMFVDKYLKRLGDLVAQHTDILEQTMVLKKILSTPMLGQLACSGMLICFVGYQATTTIAENLAKFAMSVCYMGYNMFTLYLICRWCEEITLQSKRIGQSAYFSGWESGISQAPGVRATVILVVARANKPLIFLAGGMYPLSLSSYTNLVKASYSALNILLTTGHE